jgi:hypothetical protein
MTYLPPTRETRQCPISGGVEGAEAGTLSIMVGGEERDVADAWAVLSACGNPVHLGPLGSPGGEGVQRDDRRVDSGRPPYRAAAFAWMVPGELALFGLDELERTKEWAAG